MRCQNLIAMRGLLAMQLVPYLHCIAQDAPPPEPMLVFERRVVDLVDDDPMPWQLATVTLAMAGKSVQLRPHWLPLPAGRSTRYDPAVLDEWELEVCDRLHAHYADQHHAFIAQLAARCELSEQQRAQLRLAARGQASRKVRLVKNWLSKFGGPSKGSLSKEAREELVQLNQQLNREIEIEDSLFVQTMESVLTSEQLDVLAQVYVIWFAQIAQRAAVLGPVEYARLQETLLRHCETTPFRFSRSAYVTEVVEGISDAELKAILSTRARLAIRRLTAHYASLVP